MKAITLGAALLFSGIASAQPTTWTVDNTHASVIFKVSHLGFSNVYGMIPGMEGTIVFDEAKPEKPRSISNCRSIKSTPVPRNAMSI